MNPINHKIILSTKLKKNFKGKQIKCKINELKCKKFSNSNPKS